MKFFTIATMSLMLSLSAFAEKTSTVKRSLFGDDFTCSVSATYVPAEEASCGDLEEDHGEVEIDGSMSVEKGKSYYARYTLINSKNQIVDVAETDVQSAGNFDHLVISDYYISLSSYGNHAVKMQVFNANTNQEICTTQSEVFTAKETK